MATVIRKNLRNFISVMVLVVFAAITSYVIVQQQRLRIPVLEEKPFELKADFQTAQAVVAGQGQTIDIAGVRIGDVNSVELQNGIAVVTFAVDRKYVPIYKNATILLRPRTGLKDMFFDLDPGTRDAGQLPEGGTVPLANTAPDVNLDEVLSALDGDTRAAWASWDGADFTFHRTEYDVERSVAAARGLGEWGERMIKRYTTASD